MSEDKKEEESTKWTLAERIASKITGKQFTVLFIVIVVAYAAIEITKLIKESNQ